MLTSIQTFPCLDANKVTFLGDSSIFRFLFLDEATCCQCSCIIPAVTLLFGVVVSIVCISTSNSRSDEMIYSAQSELRAGRGSV